MAKTKHKKKKASSSTANTNTAALPGTLPLQSFAQTVFKQRAIQFQKNGSEVDAIYEGLDFDPIRLKRRISSVLAVAEEVSSRYSDICPDIPEVFSLAEDWVTMNSYPVSAYDHVEKHIYSSLGAAIWVLDNIRDHGKTDILMDILRNAPPADEVAIPDVWDPCHSQQLLRQMVSIINNRNTDCPVTEKAVRKNRTSVARIYMDRTTAENKIDHSVPSRQLYDQVIALIEPNALTAIESAYTEKHWEWLRRYFLCRALFNREEQAIRAEIREFQAQMKLAEAQTRKPISILSNASTSGRLSALDLQPSSEQFLQARTLEYQNRILYEKQEQFNTRFSSFTREVGEFAMLPTDDIASRYGEEIAQIWEGFEIDEPYSMCMAFLSLLDRNSDIPWCYFPSVILQSAYVGMLPWTRTRYIPNCDDIWEHYDVQADTIVPGPTDQPLPKKIKMPDMDQWYRLQYRDEAKAIAGDNSLFSLSHILYEVTGCLMPRTPQRHLAALNTLNRYGINTKKANQHMLYCMSLLGEAKHQTLTSHLPLSYDENTEPVADTVEALQEQVTALREELTRCKLALQDASSKNGGQANQMVQIQRQLLYRDFLLHDLSSIVFESKLPTIPHAPASTYHTASSFVVFSVDEDWRKSMKAKLPDILFFREVNKENTAVLRGADTVWIHPPKMSFDEYRRIIQEARKYDVPVRIFPFNDAASCSTLLVQADISR